MNGLAYDLSAMALRNGEGAFTTKFQRHRGLQLIARELKLLGFELPGSASIKPKHSEALVAKWQADGLAVGTIKNRLAWIRFWTEKQRKSSVIPASNAELGVGRRATFNGNKAEATTGADLAKLDERMALICRLQMAFGLRLEESLKFQPATAYRDGKAVHLVASWCKGGRARSIPITHPRQRELLDEALSLVGDGCMTPDSMEYIDYRRTVERATWGLGIHNMHKHRHWYAQWRYRTLTGRQAPAAGGATYENLSRKERAADYRARLQISRELGHNRIGITDAYLGSRFAEKGEGR